MPADKGNAYTVQLPFRTLLWKLWIVDQQHNITSQCVRDADFSPGLVNIISFFKKRYAVLKWEKHPRLENKYVNVTIRIWRCKTMIIILLPLMFVNQESRK